MRKTWLALCAMGLLLLGLAVPAAADQAGRETRLLRLTAKDGVTLEGKLDMPEGGNISRLVIYVNGSGPNTYL